MELLCISSVTRQIGRREWSGAKRTQPLIGTQRAVACTKCSGDAEGESVQHNQRRLRGIP